MNNGYSVTYKPEHECSTCKFKAKCYRYSFIVNTLKQLEVSALSEWRMDLTTFIRVQDCDMYKINPDLLQVEVEYVDEEIEEQLLEREALLASLDGDYEDDEDVEYDEEDEYEDE